MSAHQATYPVATMCRVLGVSASGYYAWRNREPSEREREDEALTERTRTIHEESYGTYGAPRVHAELREQGVRVGWKRVARLMRQARFQGVSRRRGATTTVRKAGAPKGPDLVGRDFAADGPDQLWVADITYVPTGSGFLYLASGRTRSPVLDAFSRRVVGWAMAGHLRAELVLAALDMAVGQRDASGVVHHSDHGCQYTSRAFSARCREAGVRPSLGSVGDCYDNAMPPAVAGGRELLRHAGVRAPGPSAVRDEGGGADGRVPLHRGVVQPASAALGALVRVPDGARAASPRRC